jgi:Leucine-rich repeat (LRR) protein
VYDPVRDDGWIATGIEYEEMELILRIRQAATEGWDTLSLAKQAITSIPKEIGQLKKLRELHLLENKLVEVPSAIAELTELRVLSLARNRLEELPPQIAKLPGLRKL